jgi:hypothetical protein
VRIGGGQIDDLLCDGIGLNIGQSNIHYILNASL